MMANLPGCPCIRLILPLCFAGLLITAMTACDLPFGPPPPPEGSGSLVLFATPKFIGDFDEPDADVARFLDHYAPLITPSAETVVIFAVGNSDHVLRYRGPEYWQDELEWARWTDDWHPFSQQTMDYRQVAGIVQAFKREADERGITLKVFDQVDKGREFAHVHWRYSRHPECHDFRWDAYDIRGRMKHDDWIYASAPGGIPEGTNCGRFLVDQVTHYINDLGFDGILYGNQLATRGGWLPDNGPGYSEEEAAAILDFLQYSRDSYGDRELMWFDSYNTVDVERDVYSFPAEGYALFDYIIVSGFCVVTFTERYEDNLASKLPLADRTRLLATLDYVDPWYSYKSMTQFKEESERLERIAIRNRDQIAGLVFFANDEQGRLVPRNLVDSFAGRYFAD